MFDFLIIDSVLMGYLVLNSKENMRDFTRVGSKRVYKSFVRNFIETINYLKATHLKDDGDVILLFDNYESREEIRQLLKPLHEHESRKKINPVYKAQRRAEKQDFYSSLDIIRYYYDVADKHSHTVHIPNLEADDLVRPCIEYIQKGKSFPPEILLVTNDSDWCRYLHEFTKWLPDLYGKPQGISEFTKKFGFVPTEEAIILNKIIYGDDADNIKCVFPEFNGYTRKFIVQTFHSIADFMFSACDHEDTKEYLSLIKERELQIRSAYQMLATIPVTADHFRNVFVTGRDSKIVQGNLRRIFFDQDESKNPKESGFEFGVKIPRHEPKGEV
jgi:hypothetical protein